MSGPTNDGNGGNGAGAPAAGGPAVRAVGNAVPAGPAPGGAAPAPMAARAAARDHGRADDARRQVQELQGLVPAAARRAAARGLEGRSSSSCSPSAACSSRSSGPKILGEATNVIFAGAVGADQHARPAPRSTQVVAGLNAAGQTQPGRACSRACTGVVPGQGIDFAAARPDPAAGRRRLHRQLGVRVGASAYIMAGVTQRTVYRLRRRVDEKLGRLPLSYFDGQSRGDILSRVTNDIDNISQTLQQSLTQLITSVLTVIGVLIMMLTISPLLALISLLAVPASMVVDGAHRQALARSSSSPSGSGPGTLNGHIEEMHTGHAIVKLFGRQEEAIEAFDAQNEALYQASYRAQFISGLIQPAMTFISNLNYVAICVIGGIQVANGQMSLGDVQAFIQYSRQFTFPIIQAASIANVLQSAVASAERVFELLDEAEEIPDPVAPRLLAGAGRRAA